MSIFRTRSRNSTGRLCLVLLAACLAACSSKKIHEPDPKLVEAQALFKAHCANAGERIVRTVDNVDGIFLMKIRATNNFANQFEMDDPYGDDLVGKAYIESFLRARFDVREIFRQRHPPINGHYHPGPEMGYANVDAIDSQDNILYRYVGRVEQPGLTDPHHILDYWQVAIDRSVEKQGKPRYGVTFAEISTQEDRLHWIAGGSLQVIDLEGNEVIAERIGYMMDYGMGNKSGGRSPWLMAASLSCPQFPGEHPFSAQTGQTDRFVEKVLRPSRAKKD